MVHLWIDQWVHNFSFEHLSLCLFGGILISSNQSPLLKPSIFNHGFLTLEAHWWVNFLSSTTSFVSLKNVYSHAKVLNEFDWLCWSSDWNYSTILIEPSLLVMLVLQAENFGKQGCYQKWSYFRLLLKHLLVNFIIIGLFKLWPSMMFTTILCFISQVDHHLFSVIDIYL